MSNTIKNLLEEERPYEKCGRFGAESLTDTELLAVMLRSGIKGKNALETAKESCIRMVERVDCPGFPPTQKRL